MGRAFFSGGKVGMKMGSSRLPKGFTELVYIESTGMQYIDSNVPATQNIGFEVDFLTNSSVSKTGYGAIFGCINSGSNRFGVGTYPDKSGGQFLYGSACYDPAITTGKRMSVSLLNRVFTTPNGTTSVSTTTFSVGATITLFARKWTTGSVDEFSKTRIYSCKIYDNGTLIRDFVPCLSDADGVGLFDLVSNQFYGNAGSGSFTGSEVAA